MAGDNDDIEVIRSFKASIADLGVTELRQLTDDLTRFAAGAPDLFTRPELRRTPRGEVAIYRVRVDIDGARPPIWRRLDLRSDLHLDLVHQVIQAVFGWTDTHLHRFSLGGGPFDNDSQLFLCPYDIDEGEEEDDGGVAACDVRLDETLQEKGDVLHYLYDYGDMWELTLRLEEVRQASAESPMANLIDGRRAAPPEDCGGLADADSLAEILDAPESFEIEEANQALHTPYFLLQEHNVDQRLVEIVGRLGGTRLGEILAARMISLTSEPRTLSPPERAACLRAYQWFLDRGADGAIELTSAGYLKPTDVEAASKVVPAMGDWFGQQNREVHARPLLGFRQALQSMGLLRKHKGALVLTRAGVSAQRDSAKLWDHLASRLPAGKGDSFENQATLVLLAYAGTSDESVLPLDEVAEVLTELGWRHADGRTVAGYELYDLPVLDVLGNISDHPASRGDRRRVSSAAAALARAALCHPRTART